MKKFKVCVYAIAKNEEKFVDRWMDSVSEADIVVVLDTGSTDDTVAKLKKRGAKVFSEEVKPWRFDVARNKAMSYIPSDIDICVSNDLDEVFEKGWRKKLEDAWGKETTRARYLFSWSYHSNGNPNKQFPMEKIHSRNNYRWIHPIHEILEYTGKSTEKTIFVNNLILNHYPDNTKSRTQYLPLLELSATENPSDPQTIFWLGREYFYYKKYEQCINTLDKYLNLPKSTWMEERSAAMRFIADSYFEKHDNHLAKKWYFKAIAESITTREPYLSAAVFGYKISDWKLVYLMTSKGLSIKNKTGSYLVDTNAWNELFYDLGAIACYNLEMYDKSLEYASMALNINSSDERLRNNFNIIQEKKNQLRNEE